MTIPHPIHDVVIVGAGPVGLFLACELRLAGVSVLVLEQSANPQSPLKELPFGMRGLTVPTVEAFYRRNLLDEIVAAQRTNDAKGATRTGAHWMQQQRRPAGHFAGIQFFQDNIDAAHWPYHVPGPAHAKVALDMQSLESILEKRAIAMGAEIKPGLRVESFAQLEDAVIVSASGDTFAARWLVGCDGGRSVVRKIGGFEFVGTDPELTGYSIEVELADPDMLKPGRIYTPTGVYTYAKPGTITMADFDGGAFHRAQPITREHVQDVLRRVTGVDVKVITLRLAATWTDRAHRSTAYRNARVLLAGDAAHIHSPLGGQGLNLGLGDAMNLGWKLAATIRGHAPSGLLDTYFAERAPEACRVLDWSRAQVALMRPTRSARALEAIIRDLMETRDAATYFAEKLCGVSMRYDLGDAHPLVGRSAPDFGLADGTRAGSLLRDGKALLLDFDHGASRQALWRRWVKRINYIPARADNSFGLSALLVRPDGIVAWASDSVENDEGLAHAASRWLGDPAALNH